MFMKWTSKVFPSKTLIMLNVHFSINYDIFFVFGRIYLYIFADLSGCCSLERVPQVPLGFLFTDFIGGRIVDCK